MTTRAASSARWGLQGGYGPEQKYNRDQLTLAHTGRFGFGTWDTSFMVNRTETMGRTVPPGTPARHRALRARWRWKARCWTASWSCPGVPT